MKISTIAGISDFIQGPLIQNLRDDAKDFRIILERDLEYRIYHHITTEIDEKKFLIMGNKTISGIRTSAKKTRGTKSDNAPFVMPDIMIRDNDKPNDIRIIMELKSDKETDSNVYLNTKARRESFEADFDNLRNYWNNHKLKKHLKHEFFIYLYRDDSMPETIVVEEIAKKLRRGKKSCYKQLIPIAINRYQKVNGKFYNQPTRDKIDDEFKRIDDIQAGSNNSKKPIKKKPVKKKSSKKKNPLTKKQRSMNAKKYWRTKKKLQNRMTEETRKKYGLPPKGKKPKKGRR